MAIPIRYTCSFKSTIEQDSGGHEYTMRILDSQLTGDANLPFTAGEDGFRIWYVGEDQEFQDPIKASMLTIPFVVQTPQDAAFINSVILTQESQFYVEVLKDGTPFWRGIILTDEMTYEVAPYPYIVELTASDGLGELKEIFEKGGNSNIAGGEFDNITSRIVAALTRMPSYAVWEDTDPILQSCVKWFDVGMPSNTIDPFTHTKFNDKNIVYTIDENTGEEELISQYEVLNTILRGWNCRIMQVNARFYVLQCSEYENANLDTFIYSGEYTSGILPTDTGVLGSNVPLDVNYNIGLNWSFDYVKEADAVYQFLAALRYARVKFDGELAPLFYKRVDVDLTTLQTTNQFTIANGVLGLDVQGSHFVQLEDTITPATQAKINYTLTTSITLKIGAFYWDGSTWTNTVSTFDVVTNNSFISEGNIENLTVPFNFTTAPIPLQDDLEIKVESTVLVTSILPSGASYNVVVITNRTTIDIFYDDPTGTGLNINYFETKNDLFPNSTVGIDLGDVIIGDRDISLQLGNYILWNNNPTKQWRYNSVAAGGSAINQLLVRELVHQRKNPRRKFELDIRGSFEAYQRITFEGRYFILNGGTFTARDESFECTMLELSRVEGNVTDESSTGAGNPGNPTFSICSGLENGLNDRMRWAGNFNELLPGAVLQPNDVTLENGYLSLAKTATTDPPAPVQDGDVYKLIGDTWTPTGDSDTSIISSGHEYTFTEGRFLKEVLVYPAFVGGNYTNTIHIADVTDVNDIRYTSIVNPPLTAQEWNVVSIGNTVVKAGTKLIVWLEAVSSISTTDFTDVWEFGGNSNNGAPPSQGWNKRSQNNLLRVEYISTVGDYETEIKALIQGSMITITEQGAPQNTLTFLTQAIPTDEGTYADIPVSLISQSGTITDLSDCDIVFSSPIAQPTSFILQSNFWNANPPSGVSVTPILQFDGVDQSPDVNIAFGVDLQLQDGYISEDYDILAYSQVLANPGSPEVQVNKIKTGFLDYNDTTGSIDLTEDVWTDVPNNGAGSFTNKLYKPDDVDEVLDVSTGYLDFSDITLGSQLLIRNDFTVIPGTNNSLLEIRYVLGQGAGEYALKFWSERLDSGSGIGYQRVTSFPIYMGDNNTKGGVGKLQVKLSTDGSITNAGSYIKIDLR